MCWGSSSLVAIVNNVVYATPVALSLNLIVWGIIVIISCCNGCWLVASGVLLVFSGVDSRWVFLLWNFWVSWLMIGAVMFGLGTSAMISVGIWSLGGVPCISVFSIIDVFRESSSSSCNVPLIGNCASGRPCLNLCSFLNFSCWLILILFSLMVVGDTARGSSPVQLSFIITVGRFSVGFASCFFTIVSNSLNSTSVPASVSWRMRVPM